jgi:hypothetical protein
MKSFWKFTFIEESGSQSEMEILGCDKLPLYNRNLALRFREARDEEFCAQKIRFDKIEKK